MHAAGTFDGAGLRFPFVQRAGGLHLERADGNARFAVEPQLDGVAGGGGGHAGEKVRRAFTAEIHAFDSDVSAVFLGAHEHARLGAAARLGLDAFFVADGGRFNLREGIERADLRDTFIVPPPKFLDRPVGIVSQFRRAYRTPFVFHVGNFPVELVIKTEDLGFAFEINDPRMVSIGQLMAIHDVSLELPRPGGVRAHRVTDAFGTAGGGVGEIVMPIAFEQPRAFLIIPRLALGLHDFAGIGSHVLVELHIQRIRVTEIKICLAIVIHKNRGINIAIGFVNQRMAGSVLERAQRLVRDGDGDDIFWPSRNADWDIKIELTLPFDDLRRPGVIFLRCPRERR